MSKRIKNLPLNSPPTPCRDLTDFNTQLQNLNSVASNICIYTYQNNGISALIFAGEDSNGQVDTANVVALDLPCPPFCDPVFVETV